MVKSKKDKVTIAMSTGMKTPSNELFVGIDPGANGAIIGLQGREVMNCFKMPRDERGILDILHEVGHLWEVKSSQGLVRLEWIHPAIQGVGKSSMSKLYGNYMQLRMALAASGLRWETVRAQDWQRALGIARRKKTETTTQWKNRLKARAQQLFPQEKIMLWNCDALLIATYCQRFEQGMLKK